MLSQYIVLPKGLSFSPVFSLKPEPVTTLWYMLHEIPDPRRAQGRRHSLPIVLTLAILALCCGSLSYLAMQEWCENYQDALVAQVPFLSGHLPNAATFHRVFSRLDEKIVEEVFGAWIQSLTPLKKGEGIALDGKTLHGTGIHLVAAFAHQARGVLFEMGTDTKGKELVIGPQVIQNIVVKDRIVTADALFSQRNFCSLIATRGGGFVFRVKENQEILEKEIRLFFKDPPCQNTITTNTTYDHWKGRVEERIVRVTDDPELLSYLGWEHITHVWYMKKEVTSKGKTTVEESVGIARIPEELLEEVSPVEKIAEAIRGHWGIENGLHRQRDVTFNEDKGTIRKGNGPQIMATLRNVVTSLFYRGTVRNFKTAFRRFAAKPEELFFFLGLSQIAAGGNNKI